MAHRRVEASYESITPPEVKLKDHGCRDRKGESEGVRT